MNVVFQDNRDISDGFEERKASISLNVSSAGSYNNDPKEVLIHYSEGSLFLILKVGTYKCSEIVTFPFT
jgi:hypothetical protein